MSDALPDGWLVRVSRSKGKVYYYHTPTKQTQWVRPTAADIARVSELAKTAAASTTVNDNEADDSGAARKRQRIDDPSASVDAAAALTTTNNDSSSAAAAADVNASNETPLSADRDGTTAASGSKTRAMIAMSMRVGGSAFVARQSSFGPLASTTGSKPRAAFTPWDHQLEAIERMMLEIETQDADAKAAVRHCEMDASGPSHVLIHFYLCRYRRTSIAICSSTVLALARP